MRTLNVLIVDDESFIVDWMISLLDSEPSLSLNLRACYSVTEALRVSDENRVDILLSDIRMPDGNGLDLVTAVHGRWADCRALMLTAYSDFSYAQKAIRNGVDGYILKNEKDSYILGEVRRVAEELNRVLDERQRNRSVQRDLDHYMLLYRSAEFFHWLRGDYLSPERLARCPGELGLAEGRAFHLVVGRAQRDGEPTASTLDILRVKQSGQCELAESSVCAVAEYHENDAFFLVQPREKYETNYQALLESQFEIAADSCQSLYGISVSFAVSPALRRPEDLPNAYWAIVNMLGDAARDGEGFVYRMPETAAPTPDAQSYARLIPDVAEALQRGSKERFSELVYRVERGLPDGADVQSAAFQNAYLCVALAIVDYASHAGTMTFDAGALYQPALYPHVQDAFGYLRNLALGLLSDQSNRQLSGKRQLVEEIDRFVAQNARSDLSLADLSNHFNYNAGYLSRLYSSQTGITLKKSITQQRLNQIDELMRNPALSLNDVAEQAGFTSRAYFNFFIKHTLGETPSQHRQGLTRQP